MSPPSYLSRAAAIHKLDRLDQQVSMAQSERSAIEEELESQACPSCGGPIKTDEVLCCWGCLMTVNRLLARLTVEQIACRDEKSLVFLKAVKHELDSEWKNAVWLYSLGVDAVESSLAQCYYPTFEMEMELG